MDLSDYAAIYILIIILGTALLVLAAYMMEKPAIIILGVALIGLYLSFFVIDRCDFVDASIEAVITTMALTMLPASIIVCRWAFKEFRNRKIRVLKTMIIEDFESRKRELIIEKEHFEKELLINSSLHNLLMLLQLCVSANLNFYENHALRIDREKRNELLKKINDRKEEPDIIDSRIKNLQTDSRYFHLLRIYRKTLANSEIVWYHNLP